MIHEAVGTKFFFNTLWSILLKDKKNKLSCLKVLNNYYLNNNYDSFDGDDLNNSINNQDVIKKTEILSEEDKTVKFSEPVKTTSIINKKNSKYIMSISDIDILKQNITNFDDDCKELLINTIEFTYINIKDNYFPNISLVVNSIISCLEDDDNKLILMSIWDFIKYNFNLYTQIIIKEEGMINIIESILWLLRKKDASIMRRIYELLLDCEIENFEYNDSFYENIFKLIIKAFKKIFLNKNFNKDSYMNPFQIIKNISEDNSNLLNQIIKEISFDMINYLYIYSKNEDKDISENILIVIKEINDIFNENFESFLSIFYYNLNENLEINNKLVYKLTEFFFINYLDKSNLNIEIKYEYLLKTLELFIIIYLKNDFNNIILDKFGFDNLLFLNNNINLITNVLEILSQLEYKPDINDKLRNIIIELCNKFSSNHNDFFEKIDKYSNHKFSEMFLKIYNKLLIIIFRLQDFIVYDKDMLEIPNWFNTIIKSITCINETISIQGFTSVNKLIKIYNNNKAIFTFLYDNIFLKEDNYEINALNWKILKNIFNYIEISEYKDLFINIIREYSKYKIEFINKFINILLTDEINSVNIRRVNCLWNLTFNWENPFIKEILYSTVFQMVSFIDHNNPLYRYNCKNWLDNSFNYLDEILNPIFTNLIPNKELLLENKIKNTDLVHLEDNIILIQKIINNINDIFNNHFLKVNYIPEDFTTLMKDFNSKFMLFNLDDNFNQMGFLIMILISLMKSSLVEDLEDSEESLQKKRDNLNSVKSLISNLLQTIILNLKNEDYILFFSKFILKNLLSMLNESIKDNIIILQFEYLLLINNIMLKQNFLQINKFKCFILDFIEKSNFLDTIIKGLNNEHSFIIKEFVKILNNIIKFTNDNFKPSQLLNIINKIIITYCIVINKKSMIIENETEYDSNKMENIKELLSGLDFILWFFLKIKRNESIEKPGNFDILVSVMSLGIKKAKTIKKDMQFEKDNEICKNILDSFGVIFESLINCWKLENDFNYLDLLNLNIKNNNNYNEFSSWKIKILEIIRRLFLTFNIKLMENIIEYWLKSIEITDKKKFKFVNKGENTKLLVNDVKENIIFKNHLKIIEIFLSLKFDLNTLIYSILKSSQINKIKKFIPKEIKNEKNRSFKLINYEQSKFENYILHLIYCLIKNSSNFVKFSEIILYWKYLFKIIKIFENSINPQTICWILNIFNISIDKVKPSDIFKNDKKFKDYGQSIIFDLFSKISLILSHKLQVIYNQKNIKFFTLYPFPPSVIETLKENEDLDYSKKLKIKIDRNDIILNLNNEEYLDIKFIYYLYYTFNKYFLRIYFDLLSLDSQKVIYKSKLFMDNLFFIFYNKHLYFLIEIEQATKILYSIVYKNSLFIKEFKKEIMEIYNLDNFFKSNIEILSLWSKLINKVSTLDNEEYFNKYLNKVNFKSIFFNKSSENKERIKAFQRVCFLIYSCDDNKYLKKNNLIILFKKIKEVLKDENLHSDVIIIILFSLRILLIKMNNNSNMDDLFLNLQPLLLNLIAKLLKFKKDNKVFIGILKLIELINYLEIVGLQLHNWAFIFSCVGVKISNTSNDKDYVTSPFVFTPLILLNLDSNLKIEFTNEKIIEDNQFEKEERKLLIKENYIKDDEKINNIYFLKAKSQEIITNFLYWNYKRTFINPEEIEIVVQGDFIELGDLIS